MASETIPEVDNVISVDVWSSFVNDKNNYLHNINSNYQNSLEVDFINFLQVAFAPVCRFMLFLLAAAEHKKLGEISSCAY